RSWHPSRKIVQTKKIKSLDLLCFSFPFYPVNNNFITGLQLFFYQLFMRFFLGKLLKQQDIIHSVGASFSGVVGGYLSAKLDKPHIAQCIGTDINATLPHKKNSYFYSVMKKHVDIYTTNSFALEQQVNKIYPAATVQTIYRGVNLDFFTSDNVTAHNDKIIFAFIGGLSYREEHSAGRDYKGGITLLKAWQALNNYSRAELHFAGPDVTGELVEDILEQDPKLLNINVTPYLDRNAVKNLFELADVVVIPSWMEGLPNAGMEAMASSCALLGTNVGGIPELISNNNGYLFEPGNSEALATLMQQMIADPDCLRLLKKNSRTLALNAFESKQFPRLYRELYEKL
ncbi:MAG: glycosyltransferase, partial [Sphingobacteriales bacterium]